MTGTIIKALSGFYYVDCDGETVTCRARGKFRHAGTSPLVGDRVEITALGAVSYTHLTLPTNSRV